MAGLKKLQQYALELASAVTLAGCVGSPAAPESPQERTYSTPELEMGPLMVRHLNGYTVDRFDETKLMTLAGIQAGTVRVKKLVDGGVTRYVAEGDYSRFANPGALKGVLEKADKNGDFEVSGTEVRELQREMYEKHAED